MTHSTAADTTIHAAHAANPAPHGEPPRLLADPAWLVRGNPDHADHDPLGLRNPRGIQLPELAVIGGGQVYGEGLSHAHSWPAQLGRRMGGGVINAGLPGWGSVQYALIAERLLALSPRRFIVCLTPAADLPQTFLAARNSTSRLARSFFEPQWARLPHPDQSIAFSSGRAVADFLAAHPDTAEEDALAILAQRGEPDVNPCVIDASRFYLTERSLHAMLDLDHPAIEAGLSITAKVLAHLRALAEEHLISLTVLLLPSREYLVAQRLDEARVRDAETLERLGLAEAAVLGELRAVCAGLSLRCFDLTGYLKAFVGGRIHAQNRREGWLSAKGCELLSRFVRERVLPGAVVRMPERPAGAAVGGIYPLY
ncbi:MAG: hypothetical protein HY916_06045 [Desulfovibrio sp.]|jgi:hypothetical protein|nr:hypothetical protein [Desulfovibrio sp.]